MKDTLLEHGDWLPEILMISPMLNYPNYFMVKILYIISYFNRGLYEFSHRLKRKTASTVDLSWNINIPVTERLTAFDTYIYHAEKSALGNNIFRIEVEFALNPGWVEGIQKCEMKTL